MSQIAKGLIWAAAMIALALAVNAGLIARETAEPMFVIMPILAVLTIGKNRNRAAKAGCRA